MANFPGRQSTKFTEYYTRGGREESPRRSRQFREEHVHREHNQEAHRSKIDIYRRHDPTTWKAIRGVWDGSFKDDDKSGCGIVIRRVVGRKWVTISEIAVLLKVSAAMAVEVVMRAHGCLRSNPV